MKVAVVGLGGVGGYLAASFARAGIDVTGFGRGKHLEAIKEHGIRIKEDENSWSVRLEAKEIGEAEGVYDVVLFCVKSYDLQQSCQALLKHIDQRTILLSFANGVNNGEILRSNASGRILEGAIYILSHIQSPGTIRKQGSVFAAVFGGEDDATQEMSRLFARAKLRYKTPSNITEALWKKYTFISAFASLTSYYDMSIKKVYEEYPKECQIVLGEIASVAKTYGVSLESEIPKALSTAATLPQEASTSMHLDFKNSKKVELESLSGFIANYKGVDTPFMSKIYETLKRRESAKE